MNGLFALAVPILASRCLDRAAQPAPAARDAATFQVELAVARDLLRPYAGHRVVVDSFYAEPEQAPPAPARDVRPRAHNAALAGALATGRPGRAGAVVVRLSQPQLRRDTAEVSTTVDAPSAHTTGRRSYETVRYRLVRDAGGWRVRHRTQLGIS